MKSASKMHEPRVIERLWKFVKKQSLYSKYYADFAAFKTAITDCLSQTHTTHKEALDSLLTLRFQTFEKAQSVTVLSMMLPFQIKRQRTFFAPLLTFSWSVGGSRLLR